MGRWYRDKKSSGCALCKPWKHGWALRFNNKELQFRKITDKIISEAPDHVRTWEDELAPLEKVWLSRRVGRIR